MTVPLATHVASASCYAVIDLGTTGTGYASSMPEEDNIVLTTKYPEQPPSHNYCKQPSILVYKRLCSSPSSRSDWDFIGTGFKAENEFRALANDQHNEYVLIQYPKLVLAEGPRRVEMPPGLSAEDVLTDWISAIAEPAIAAFKTQWGTYPGFNPNSIHWTFTVPASWSHHAKSTIRAAAYAAHLIPTLNSPSLSLYCEPEAAALNVLRENNMRLSTGDRVMVIDAGGGTVDVYIGEVVKQKDGERALQEVVPCNAVLAGGSFLDAHFKQWMVEQLGINMQTWQQYELEQPNKARQMLVQWEAAKGNFGWGGKCSDFRLDMPESLISILAEDVQDRLEDADGQLIVTAAAMKEVIFAPVVSGNEQSPESRHLHRLHFHLWAKEVNETINI